MVKVKVKDMGDKEEREEKAHMDSDKAEKLEEKSAQEDHEKGRAKRTKKATRSRHPIRTPGILYVSTSLRTGIRWLTRQRVWH